MTHWTPLPHHHHHRRRRRRRRRHRQHVKNAAQDVAEDVAEDVAQDCLRGPGGACPPRDITTAAAAAVFVQLAEMEAQLGSSLAFAVLGAQLGSSVAFGSGCGQALPGVPHKAPL